MYLPVTLVILSSELLLQELFVPLVKRLGYEYSDSETPDISLLRTLAVGQSTNARDPT